MLLKVDSLSIRDLNDVTFSIARGETVAVMGPSGSGKTTLAHAALGLSEAPVRHGKILWNGVDLLKISKAALKDLRGREIGYVAQNRLGALNPILSIAHQIAEPLRIHFRHSDSSVKARLREVLSDVGLSPDEKWEKRFPHQLSGGQRQRAMIAMALICRPRLLLLDEPTSSLDAITAWEMMRKLKAIATRDGMAIWMNTHHMRLSRDFADRIVRVGSSPSDESENLTGIRASLTSQDTPVAAALNGIQVAYKKRGLWRSEERVVVDGADLELRSGECLGLVGRSGCGKTTLARVLCGILKPAKGGLDVRGRVQMIFQDASSAFNPHLKIKKSLEEPLRLGKTCKRRDYAGKISDVLAKVGLDEALVTRFPNEVSGGELQRAAIARALLSQPRILVLDEPTAGLDGDNQKKFLRLLGELQSREGMSYLFICHDLELVREFCHRVAVMKDGRISAVGGPEEMLGSNTRRRLLELQEDAQGLPEILGVERSKENVVHAGGVGLPN